MVHNGALIKDLVSGQTLQQSYIPLDLYHQALALLRRLSAPLVYIDAFHENIDILTESMERAHPFQRAYLTDQLAHCRIVDDITRPLSHGVVLMSLMADGASLHTLRRVVAQTLGTRGRVHLLMNKNYQGYILEIMQAEVSKWQALQRLAAQHQIAPEEIIAVGDDQNDLDMIRSAGLGIAMGNAVPEVKMAAKAVTGSNADDGLVQALERFILHA